MARSRALNFEPLQPGHIEAVVEIERASNPAPWSKRSFENEIGARQSLFLVAVEHASVVGFAGLWMVVDEAHITNVAVHPDRRREGIAGRMIAELLRQARERGMASATLEVRRSNAAAQALYRSLGFVEAAVRKGYYPDNREDAIVMWLYDLAGWTPDQKRSR